MPDNARLLFGSRISQDLNQFPDPRLYKAASLLGPRDRPTVPVRFYEDPDKLYDEVLQLQGAGRLSPNNIMAVPPDKKTIFVNRNSKRMKDAQILASKLAHEQVHVAGEDEEIPAYEKEVEVLGRLRRPSDEDLMGTRRYLDALKRSSLFSRAK